MLNDLLIVSIGIGIVCEYVDAGCDDCEIRDSKVMLNDFCCLNKRKIWDKKNNDMADPKRKICCDFTNQKPENKTEVEYIKSIVKILTSSY